MEKVVAQGSFADLTEKETRRAAHRSTCELEWVTNRYTSAFSETSRPFQWHETADGNLASIRRFCLRILEAAAEARHNGMDFGAREPRGHVLSRLRGQEQPGLPGVG